MYKFWRKDFETAERDIDVLEVQSFEMNVYLVQLSCGAKTGLLYDDSDKPMRFYSAGHIREFFAQCTVATSYMKHDTPYDEMIGNPPKAEHTMALPFSMEMPY